ncbi:MAG: nitrate reductase [Deltaproteobacteria bacterium]|nr:nitrate reductase [Deltaproteobacteria bacterium]
MPFRSVFIAVVIGAAIVIGAMLLNAQRPAHETSQPSADLVAATGKCAECHRIETSAIVAQYERSHHARAGVSCLDCHRAVEGQESLDHRGFTIAAHLTAKNCAQCHATEVAQFERSRHAAPAWAAVHGREPFTDAQIAAAERYHPGGVDRAPNGLALLEGDAAITKGCATCHAIGAPNADGSIGTCTACHSRHNASVAVARQPETCGQCHMGPDHSQIEIYSESKHGVLFNAQEATMNLAAPPKALTTADMPVPTCATCHMSGLEGLKVTHDVTERLSWYLFAAVSAKRPTFETGQIAMKEVCTKCHTKGPIDRFYQEAEDVIAATNAKVKAVNDVMDGLYADGILTKTPFDEPIEFKAFDMWHYFGRTAKHGAFMGGADFVQWHGNYELLLHAREIEREALALRDEARLRGAEAPTPAPDEAPAPSPEPTPDDGAPAPAPHDGAPAPEPDDGAPAPAPSPGSP